MTFFVGILRVPIFWLTPSDIRLMESKFGHFDQNLLPPGIFCMDPMNLAQNSIKMHFLEKGWS